MSLQTEVHADLPRHRRARGSVLPLVILALSSTTPLTTALTKSASAQAPEVTQQPSAHQTETPSSARTDPTSNTPLPDPRALLNKACAWLGSRERLRGIESYSVALEATQRFRARESQQWIELPATAIVLWTADGKALVRIDETIVGPDGEDLPQRREFGRTNDVAWELIAKSTVGNEPPEFRRLPALNDPILKADPFRIVFVDLPQHEERFPHALPTARERVQGQVAVRIDLANSSEDASVALAGQSTIAGSLRSIWIVEESGEIVAVRAAPSADRTLMLGWQERDGLRVPLEMRSTALFGRDTVGIAAVDFRTNTLGPNAKVRHNTDGHTKDDRAVPHDIVAPTILSDPTMVLPAEKQRTTDDS
jgi:hypothetical protein